MAPPTAPGVYSATYSNIPVYEFQFGEGLKEHVMRRRGDDWINATHILKAVGFDKPARTRILEREVQKETHEKVQGGYGKYQGTWVPLEQGRQLAERNKILGKLQPIFDFIPGNISPPPAPKHTTAKPKLQKKPAIPKWTSMAAPARMVEEEYDNASAQYNDDESLADDITVGSTSMMDDDRYDNHHQKNLNRKRKRQEDIRSHVENEHIIYSNDLLDYFMCISDGRPGAQVLPIPDPPVNFNANWVIDNEGNTSLHWAAAMGDIEVVKQMKRHGANLDAQNVRGETPLMRTVQFTNCMDRDTFSMVVKELIESIGRVDNYGSSVLHHAAAVTLSRQKHQVSRYYLDIILNKMQEVLDPDQYQLMLDLQDQYGQTAIHIAAKNEARKCVRALIGRGSRTDIPDNEGVIAEDLIKRLNDNCQQDRSRLPNVSSSPFGPDSRYSMGMPEEPQQSVVPHISEAAISIQGRIAPLMLEKFQDLAQSFDEELVEKDTSEKEARRILKGTLEELAATKAQIAELSMEQEDPATADQRKEQLAHVESIMISYIEHQQKIQLQKRIVHEESRSNGHMTNGDDDLAETIHLTRLLEDEQAKRRRWIEEYTDGLALAGAGEMGAKYRRLIERALGDEVNLVDGNLDTLIEQLKEEQAGQEGETMMPEDR